MRQPGDLPPESLASTPLPAASVIVLRPHPEQGFEVLLMERAATSRNFAGALVFPGGKVDAGDAAIAQAAGFEQAWATRHFAQTPHAIDAVNMAALYGAALRETLEEVGLVWTSNGLPPAANQLAPVRQALLNGTPWADVAQAHTLPLSMQGMLPFSRWITPQTPNLSVKRFDTWFFLAQAPADQTAYADASEAVRLLWDTPHALLASHQRREILLAPPQIMTLAHLSRFPHISDAMAFANDHAPYRIAPVSVDEAGQRMVCFPGDPLHEEATALMPGPSRLVMHKQWFEPPHAFDELFR